ncbi:hypothetical protein GOP47_0031144, partial [Adiantum capillus-veneris]
FLIDTRCKGVDNVAVYFTDDERFDASQYAFFGGAISQEVELGGLDEEEEIASSGTKYEEDERSLNPSSDKEE